MAWRAVLLLFFLVCTLQAMAQICNGSLGDPIINITFGSGANPGAPLSAAATNYQYVSNDCPNDGFYALRNSSSACFGNTWHSITDHTGDANGYFMLVNASLQPSAFYLDTVRGLCGNTTYEFAAWILNILKSTSCGGTGIQPNLTFRMEKTDGTLLQSYNTNDIAGTNAPQWKQFGFFFTTPTGISDVVLRIVNNAQGGCGNDLALDDITFRPCGPQITISISGTTATTVNVCEGAAQNYTFNAVVSAGFNNPEVQWQQGYNGGAWSDVPGAVSTNLTRIFSTSTAAGSYAFRLAAAENGNMGSAQCRIASTPLIVQVASNPDADATNNGPLCEGNNVVFNANAANAIWSGPNGFTANAPQVNIANAQPSHSGTYYVTAINGNCSRIDSTILVVNPRPVLITNTNNVSLCEGDSAQLGVTGAENYTWTPSTAITSSTASSVFVFPVDSTIYTVIGKNIYGCSDSASVTINVLSKPVANAGTDKNVMEGMGVQLFGEAGGDNISHYWTPATNITGVYTLSPVVNPVSDTTYVLHVISNAGCGVAEDAVKIHVFKKLIIPNSFSPNNDGINDKWNIKGIETYPGAMVLVFNRYGQSIFQTARFSFWDGRSNAKVLPAGVYYYLIYLKNDLPVLSGWIAIIL